MSYEKIGEDESSASGKYYLYIKVIEARGIVPEIGSSDLISTVEPFVTIKLNGHEHLHKKSTRYQQGVQWWEQTFRFKIKDIENDWIAVEVREKGFHLLGSDWIGEIQLLARDFKDGKVHESWYKLGKGAWKNHTRQPRGYLHLAFQILQNKFAKPFEQEPAEKRQTFEEWKQSGMKMVGTKELEPTSTHKEEHDPNEFHENFDLKDIPTMQDAEKNLSKNAYKILMSENPSQKELLEMKKYNRVNCLHKGNFESCKGKKYMVCIDGTPSSKSAFESTLQLANREEDHIFIVTVRERSIPDDFYEEKSRIILTHKLWQAAADIIKHYQEILDKEGFDYTSIMPEADDAREIVCALVKKYKADFLIIGKHKGEEKKHPSKHFRSFNKYCQNHAKCSVMIF